MGRAKVRRDDLDAFRIRRVDEKVVPVIFSNVPAIAVSKPPRRRDAVAVETASKGLVFAASDDAEAKQQVIERGEWG